MERLRFLIVLLVAVTTVCTSCAKDDEKSKIEPTDNLEQFGILGQWKKVSRVVNGISNLAVECCDYIEFSTDSLPTDLRGVFNSNGIGYETNGVFELDDINASIEFVFNDEQILYGIQISETTIVFDYFENNDSIVEYWNKED